MRVIEQRIVAAMDARTSLFANYVYRDWHDHAQGRAHRDRVTIDRSTGNPMVYWLWDTPIFTLYADHALVTSGRWRTVTTKSRLNALLWHFCATNIHQEKGEWYFTQLPNVLFAGRERIAFEDDTSIPRATPVWNGKIWTAQPYSAKEEEHESHCIGP